MAAPYARGFVYATLVRNVRQQALERARRARRHLVVLIPLIAGVFLAYRNREELFGLDVPIRVAAVIALVILGWALARDAGHALRPVLYRRLDEATAGTVEFLIRLTTLALAVLGALRLAGLEPRTLAVGGAITAVVFGLAAQQTLGNLIAGTVLLSARPFRVGDRVRLQSGGLAGLTEGVVASLGLLYTTLTNGEDRIMVPNNIVLSASVVPLREPSGVDVRARLPAHVQPSSVQDVLDDSVTVPTRDRPHIALEEFDGEEVVMRVTVTPVYGNEGRQLADQVLAALSRVAGRARPRAVA